MLAGCGARQTMASKSAAAYDEAMKKGIPISAGEHGGHSVESVATQPAADHASMPGMDQTAMPGMPHKATAARTHDMAGMNRSAMAGMDHAKMPGMQHQATADGTHDMAGMDHAKMPGTQHQAVAAGMNNMAGMNHSAMNGMDPSKMPGMQHGAMAAPVKEIKPPTTNAAIAQTQPAATLRADGFDAPAATSIKEAAKAASSKSHSMEETVPKEHEQHAPQPPSLHRDHGNGEAP